jgi:prohibitin 1
LRQRAGEFNLKLEDVSITHLTFGQVSVAFFLKFRSLIVNGQEFTQAVEAKQIAQQGMYAIPSLESPRTFFIPF